TRRLRCCARSRARWSGRWSTTRTTSGTVDSCTRNSRRSSVTPSRRRPPSVPSWPASPREVRGEPSNGRVASCPVRLHHHRRHHQSRGGGGVLGVLGGGREGRADESRRPSPCPPRHHQQ